MKRRAAGLSLTEMMIVIALVGILVTTAIIQVRPRVRPIDVANRVGDLMREAGRRAVALGPVRADVVTALGLGARTRVTATASGSRVAFVLARLQEGESGYASWISVAAYTVDASVLAVAWAPGVGGHTMPGVTTDWSTFELRCSPDGTCQPRTLFFQATRSGPRCDPTTLPSPPVPLDEQCGKLSVMPLGGAIVTRTDWN